MKQRLLAALQTEGQMDVKINAMKAELAELERLVAEERRLLEETAHRRKEEERRLETLGANVYQPRLVDPESVRRKLLILAFDGLLVSIKSSAEEHSEASQHGWDVLQVKKTCFVVNFTLWSRDQCFELGKTSRPLYYKDFDYLYEYNISARDILIVEDEVAKISTNNLMNAMATVYFIEEARPWATLPWVVEPVEALMKWWGPGVKTKTWIDILFRSCTYEERKSLREMWTAITVRQKARVESVERQKSPVESAAPVESAVPVESAAPVESSTPVLTAARAATDEPSAPISSVVDAASVPSTS
ncbi:hypothetical protein R1sor_009840 [Riccia sorocarpa]|uniref:FCP1 homology domain-containing protein n=1 Tax=Riccia sorocarpa TaxID=122646 RepID=A0ABD3I2B8_9MARC